MSKELFQILGNISSLVILVPLLFSVFKYRLLDHIQIKLFYLIVLVLIVELISNVLWHKKINNLPIFHFYTVIEFLLIINIYSSVLSKMFSKKFFAVLGVVFTVFAVINTIFFQGLKTFNSNVTTMLSLFVIFFALIYFYSLLKEVKYSALETNPMFWINSGFLIYFSSNLILFFINNTLFEGINEASRIVWGLHAVVNIVLIIFYTVAIWVNPNKKLLH